MSDNNFSRSFFPVAISVFFSKEISLEKRNMSTLFMIYKDEHQLDLNRIMKEFSDRAQKLGVVLKTVNFQDILISSDRFEVL